MVVLIKNKEEKIKMKNDSWTKFLGNIKNFKNLQTPITYAFFTIVVAGSMYYLAFNTSLISSSTLYDATQLVTASTNAILGEASNASNGTIDGSKVDSLIPTKPALPPPLVITHIDTPKQVKAIYMTSWVAGTPSLRKKLVDLIDKTEVNSVVIDIKDYSGRLVFKVFDPYLKEIGSEEIRVSDFREFIADMHKRGIYVIGRVAVFQDAYMVKHMPKYAVTTRTGADKGEIWHDKKGIPWIDAGAEPVWEYIVSIAKESYLAGVDEINFDYIRFPSDGNMNDIAYPWSKTSKKSEVLDSFFAYLQSQLSAVEIKNNPDDALIGYTQAQTGTVKIPISADLFGMVTTNTDDLNIGQLLEVGLKHFDYVAPMVYPSHYPATFMGFPNPAAKPYEVVQYSMKRAVERAEAASTSPKKLRPWLQDFSINGTHYTADMVKAQIKATYDVGLDSWMIWNASNKYTDGAFLPETKEVVTLPK